MTHVYFNGCEKEYLQQAADLFEEKTTPEELKRFYDQWEIEIISDYKKEMEKIYKKLIDYANI